MAAVNNLSEIEKHTKALEALLGKFVKGGSLYGLFLKTEDEAQLKQIVTEIIDLLDEIFGKNNSYSQNVLNEVNRPTMGGGPSYAAVQNVISILKAVSTKLRRRGHETITKMENKSEKRRSRNKVDLDKITFFELVKLLNTKQLFFVIGTILTLLGGSFGIGYRYRVFEESFQNGHKNAESKQLIVNWEGTWQTETPAFKNVRISFIQSNNKVTGNYEYFSKGVEVEGRIEGEISGNTINGKWLEYHNNSKLEGQIYLVMASDARSFTGRYTRNWEANQVEYVWRGTKVN